MHLVLMFLHK